jgi:hypothetical protein
MKIKFKATFNEFSELVSVISKLPYKKMGLSQRDTINVNDFLVESIKKISNEQLNPKDRNKTRAFTIDMNHLISIREAVLTCIDEQLVKISLYTLSIFSIINSESERQMNHRINNFNILAQ